MKFGIAYIEKGVDLYEKKYQNQLIVNLSQRAKKLGFTLTKTEGSEGVS